MSEALQEKASRLQQELENLQRLAMNPPVVREGFKVVSTFHEVRGTFYVIAEVDCPDGLDFQPKDDCVTATHLSDCEVMWAVFGEGDSPEEAIQYAERWDYPSSFSE